jgi:hypothetical protein
MDVRNATTVIISNIVNETEVNLFLCQEINDLLHIGSRSVTRAFRSGQPCKKILTFLELYNFPHY